MSEKKTIGSLVAECLKTYVAVPPQPCDDCGRTTGCNCHPVDRETDARHGRRLKRLIRREERQSRKKRE